MPSKIENNHVVSSAQGSPILVTGAHRTGTTWVGKMLAASNQAAYISEPLNVWHRPGVLRLPTKHWYTYICAQNEVAYLPAISDMILFHYDILAEISSLSSLKDLIRMGRDYTAFLSARILKRRALIKDPFALFSAPWFAERLACQVVLVVRHPAAFVSSLKRLGWAFDFTNFLEQPHLMHDHLEPFRSQMDEIPKGSENIIEQGSLLWRIIYHVVDKFQKGFPNFQVIRHEDLSLSPHQGYHALYKVLGLRYSSRVRKIILKYSSSGNPKELSIRGTHRVKLDSQSNLKSWKKRLSPEEIRDVRRLTESVSHLYYSEQDWG